MSASLELFAATVTAVMLVGCFLERKHRTKTGRFLVWVLIDHTAMLLVDAPIWLLLAEPAPENVVWIKILSFFTNAFLCALISLYTYCLTAYISERKKISYRYANIITVLCGVTLLLWLISTFNGMYIYYDETGLDHTGPLYLLSQAFDIILPAMTMVLAFLQPRYSRMARYMDHGTVWGYSCIEHPTSVILGGHSGLPCHYRFACACLYIDPCGTG